MSSKNKRDAANVFESYLTKDETILWMGQPNPRWLLSSGDIFLIPFSMLWGGFALFWEGSVLSGGAPGFFALWGIPFVLVGQYIIWGRFIHKYLRRKNTYYAITERRALILNKLVSRNLKAHFLHQIASLDRQGHAVLFGSGNSVSYSQFKNQDWSGEGQPGFYALEDADEVYRLMQDLMLPEKSKIA